MRKVMFLLSALVSVGFSAISHLAIPNETISAGTPPQVVWVDQNFDSVTNKVNQVVDSFAIYHPSGGVIASPVFYSLNNLRLGIDNDANATGNYFWLSHNATDSLFRVRDDSTWRAFGAGVGTKLTLSDSLLAATSRISGNTTVGGTLGVTGTSSLTGAVTMGAYSSGRVPVFGTAGLVGQDNLYWDATNDFLGIGGNASSPGAAIDANSTIIGSDVNIRIRNGDNTSGLSNATLQLVTGGASGGDNQIRFLNGVTSWAYGLDNSDGDAIVLTAASTLGGAINSQRWTSSGSSIPGTLGLGSDFLQTSGTHTVTVTDNTANAVDIQEGTNNYINVNTTNSSERVSLGNATTNPSFDFLGTGTTTHGGAIVATQITLGGGEAFVYGDTSFTVSLKGISGTSTGTAYGVRIGKSITITFPPLYGTNNSSFPYIDGIPVGWRPSREMLMPGVSITSGGVMRQNDLLGFMSDGSTSRAYTFTFQTQ
jgi:hypothetical protein